MRRRALLLIALLACTLWPGSNAFARDCRRDLCPQVAADGGMLTASYFTSEGSGYASNSPPAPPLFTYRMRTQCEAQDASNGGCYLGEAQCLYQQDRVIGYYLVQARPLAQPDGVPVGDDVPPAGTPPGTPYADWTTVYSGCVDITDLDPGPTPEEVYRYLQTLPLPTLATQHQPPGDGLVNLPVIFFTDAPATVPFTVDIRGFTVAITTVPTTFTWHTGDGTDVISTDPGQPYPNQTVTHYYHSGTYTASLTVTWGGSYTVNGGPPTDIVGTTTTDGPAETFDVLQAHAVLTNPYD